MRTVSVLVTSWLNWLGFPVASGVQTPITQARLSSAKTTMGKFSKKSSPSKTVNLAGGEAYKESTKLELATLVLTSFVKDQFYRSSEETLNRLRSLLTELKDKKFAAQLALYARKEFGMRSVTHVLAAELAYMVKSETWTKHFYDKVIYRPDDATEIFAYYGDKFGLPFPNALKKGVAMALTRFDEYKLAKYRGEGNTVSLVDIVNLVHPKSTPAIDKLMKGTLKSRDTWESKLTEAGQKAKTDEEKAELKKNAWRELLLENKLGYFALLRNLRNITQQAPEMIDEACKQLVNPEAIKKSLVLPFRFVTAMETLGATDRRIIVALSQAMDLSLSNVPKFEGTTLVTLDTSGSMAGRPITIGSLFAAAIFKANTQADVMSFSDDAMYLQVNPLDSLSTMQQRIIAGSKSGGTNFHSIFKQANKKYDRVFILSDMQGWVGYDTPRVAFKEFSDRTGKMPIVYSFDLAGNGTLQFPEQNVFAFAGFSEKIFDVVKLFEQDKNAFLAKIESIEI